MVDNDIWFDENKADLLENFMRSLGYEEVEKKQVVMIFIQDR